MAQMRRPPADWPHPEWSDQRIVGPHRWHVQDSATSGPVMLFLHGSGASVHSWRALMDIFAGEYRVVALDLPGQGFSTPAKRSRFGLDPMAKDVLAFLDEGDISPDLIVGHSAGAAVALRMTQLRGNAMPIIGINPALGHFEGMAGWLFPVLAKVLALNPLTPWLFTMSANARQTKALIEGTGSSIDEAGLRYYEVLVSDRSTCGWHASDDGPLGSGRAIAGIASDLGALSFRGGSKGSGGPAKNAQSCGCETAKLRAHGVARLRPPRP